MSNNYDIKNKSLSGVHLMSAEEVFVFNKKTNRKDKIRSDITLVGKIDTQIPNVILKANKKNSSTKFIDDVSSLPRRCKEDVVDFFFDENGERNNRRKVYLVRTDSRSNTSLDIKNKLRSKK